MRRASALAAVAVCAGCLATLAPPAPLVLWNLTPSAPAGVYAVLPGAWPPAGALVAVELPGDLQAWAAGRGYVGPRTVLLKRVAARSGQTVCRRGPQVMVDGRLAAVARPRDAAGRALPAWSGCVRLGQEDLLLLNDAPDSLDGRYFGPISGRQVRGRAVRLAWAS